MTPAAGRAFLEQNTLAAETLTLDEVAPYAEHHSGGLMVLGGCPRDGRYVKMHDTWGPGVPDEPGNVVVHEYDPDFRFEGVGEDEADAFEQVWFFDTGREAFEFFLSRIG